MSHRILFFDFEKSLIIFKSISVLMPCILDKSWPIFSLSFSFPLNPRHGHIGKFNKFIF